MFSLLPQVVARLGVDADTWAPELEILDDLATKPRKACEEVSEVSEPCEKELLHEVFNGKTIPAQFKANTFVQRVAEVGKWYRYVCASAFPDVLDELEAGECNWLLASLAAHVYFGAEDFVLEA